MRSKLSELAKLVQQADSDLFVFSNKDFKNAFELNFGSLNPNKTLSLHEHVLIFAENGCFTVHSKNPTHLETEHNLQEFCAFRENTWIIAAVTTRIFHHNAFCRGCRGYEFFVMDNTGGAVIISYRVFRYSFGIHSWMTTLSPSGHQPFSNDVITIIQAFIGIVQGGKDCFDESFEVGLSCEQCKSPFQNHTLLTQVLTTLKQFATNHVLQLMSMQQIIHKKDEVLVSEKASYIQLEENCNKLLVVIGSFIIGMLLVIKC